MVSKQKREEFMSPCPCWLLIMGVLSLKESTGVLKKSKRATGLLAQFPPHLQLPEGRL